MKTTLRKNILRKEGRLNPLRRWMLDATPLEKQRLAVLAKTTLGTLRQASGAYRTEGELRMDPDLARRIEKATEKLQREGLDALRREQLSPACARCEFAKACRG